MNGLQKAELNIAMKFIEHTGYEILSINNYEDGEKKPDVRAKVKTGNGEEIDIGIEVTQYFGDTPPGSGSPGRLLEKIWESISNKIERERSEDKKLKWCTGLVSFNDDFMKFIEIKRENEKERKYFYGLLEEIVSEIAFELMSLTKSVVKDGITHDVTFNSFPPKYSHLVKYLHSMNISQDKGAYLFWDCQERIVGSFGLCEKEIATIIDNKCKQSYSHDWGEVDEKWLLIYSEGIRHYEFSTVTPGGINWNDKEIVNLCKQSNFDLVMFGSFEFDWYKEIYKSPS